MKKFIIKLIKKTFIILMISAMLFTAQILSNVSKATVIEQKSTVKLYSKGELICLVYNGIKLELSLWYMRRMEKNIQHIA